MKKSFFGIAFLLVALIISIIAVGCNNSGKDSGAIFIATVLENNQVSLLVEPEEDSVELRSADRITVYISEAILLDSQSREITEDIIKVGNIVQIYYDGEIAESYPAQIYGCYKIIVIHD